MNLLRRKSSQRTDSTDSTDKDRPELDELTEMLMEDRSQPARVGADDQPRHLKSDER